MDLVFLDYGARKNYLNPFIGRDWEEILEALLEALLESSLRRETSTHACGLYVSPFWENVVLLVSEEMCHIL
jgi:hypothetical protein